MKAKIIIITLISILIGYRFLFTSSGVENKETPQEKKVEQKINVVVEELRLEKYNEKINALGITQPIKEIKYQIEKNRKVESIISEGSFVKKGDLIISLDINDLLLDKKSSELKLDSMNIELESMRKLVEKKMESEFKLKVLLSNIELEKSNLEKINKQIEKSNIIADFDGFIENLDIENGEYLKTDKYISLVDISKIEVSFYISDKNVSKVKDYNQIFIRDRDYPKEGEITFVSKKAQNETNTILVKSAFENVNLRPTGFAVDLTVFSYPYNGIKIPASLLNNDNGKYFIKIIENGIVKHKYVKIMDSNVNDLFVSFEDENIGNKINIIKLGHLLVKEGQRI